MVDITQNALKFAFIASKYPEHKLLDILRLINLSPVDHNLAIWEGKKNGWFDVTEDGEEKGTITLSEDLPLFVMDAFGEDTRHVAEKLLIALQFLAEKEADMEEFSLSQWFMGYRSHDLLIAVQMLIENEKIAMYELVNAETDEEGEPQSSTYTFFTLFENRDKQWGKKQFKDQEKIEEKAD